MESDGEQWKQIHKLDQSTIRTIYSLYQKPFFVEVRESLSEWIEARFLDTNLDANNLSHHPYILQFIGDLDAEIKAKATYLSTQGPNSFTTPVKLSIAANMISSGNPMHPITLFQHICHCLQTEKEFIRQACMPQEIKMADQTFPSEEQQENVNCFLDMMTKYDDLKTKSSMLDEILGKIQCYQEDFAIKANRLEIVEDTISRLNVRGLSIPDKENFGVRGTEKKFYDEKNELEQWILDQVENIDRERLCLQNMQLEFLDCAKTFQSKVLQWVSSWKEEQLAGSRHVISIDQIQQWFDGLVHELIGFNNQLKKYTTIEQNYSAASLLTRSIVPSGNKQINVQENQSQTTQLLNELIQHALIVESQPHQLLRRGRRIAVKVRFLIGRSLQISLAYQSVQASILNEAGVEEFLSNNGSGTLIASGELVNALQKFELDGGASGYVADFRNIQIKTIEQNTRGNGYSILDDSHWLIFRAEFNYNEITHKVSALSVPTKIITHGSQELRAWETLIWDAADKNQKSDSVPWPQLAQILNNRFTMMTKKGLTPEQMQVVEDRAFSVPGGINPINGVKFITKSQFCKIYIPKMGFTFWNWFYEILELTSKHLCGNKFCKSGPWQDDKIIGFISRERAVKILENIGKPGTFLLRFSNSQLGAITVTYVNYDGRYAKSVFPFTGKDLTYHPLAERILDIENLLTLYPIKEKVQSFEPYVLPPPNQDCASLKGYVRSELRTVLKDQDKPPHHFEIKKSTGLGETNPLDRDSGISDYSSSAGDSPEERVNSVQSVSEASDHWINSYYPDPMNESPDRSGDGFSMEDYVSFSEDISLLTESIQNMDK